MPQDPELARNPDYFAARAVEERRRALSSADEKARAIHLDMAEKYDLLASGIDRESNPQNGEDRQTA